MSSDENDWIFDYVLQFLNSGRFDASVMDFVDENCAAFDNEEENKLIYSTLHNEFKDHVEIILSSNLEELDVSPEIFFQACAIGRNSRNVNKAVYDKIVAMDDFLTFKKIMVKRNTELQLEMMKAYRKIAPGSDTVFGEDDEEEFEAALRESVEYAKRNHEEPIPDEFEDVDGGKLDDFKPELVTTEEQMQEILRNSMLDMEMLHKQDEMEQLELEQAIAVSLALEDERLRQRQVEMKLLRDAEDEAEGHWEQADDDSEMYSERDMGSRMGDRDDDDDFDIKSVPEQGASAKGVPSVPDTPMAREEGKASESAQNKADDQPAKALDKHDDEPRTRKKKTKKLAAKSTLDVPEPKPLKLKELRALPEISKQAEDLEGRRRLTIDLFQRNQEVLAEQRAATTQMREALGVDDGDLEAARRARYMREQRDKLIAMKKAERETKVREEEDRRKKSAADKPRDKDVDRDFILSQSQAKEGEDKSEETTTERKRAAMRNALARRMKQELLESSEAQQAKAQEDQFSELDRQLRQVEINRRENQQRELLLAEQVRRQHEAMARNVQRSAATMKHN